MLNRRTVLKGIAAGLIAAGVGANAEESALTLEMHGDFRIWDMHSHLGDLPGDTPEERMGVLVQHMDRLGIERLILSQGYDQYIYHPTPEQVRIENDRVMRAVRHFPDRAYG